MDLQQGFQFLAEKGLNLQAVLACDTLPEDMAQRMAADGVPLADYRQMLLLGHGGRQFWRSFKSDFVEETADPIDTYSLQLAQTFIHDYLGNPPHLILYPGEYAIPLQQLGELAGWCQPSPLGLGISATYGVWFAYRTAVLLNTDLPPTPLTPSTSPCNTCTDKPCLTACPPGAVQLANFDVFTCSHYRLQENSPCQDRCLARMACPVAAEHQYTLEQIQYHYGHSWQTIRVYFEESL
jgi:hypothetical protein